MKLFFLPLLALIVSCASCKKDMRSIPICMIDATEARKGFCNLGDKKYDLLFPNEMIDYMAFSPEAQEALADVIQACNEGYKIPKNEDPIADAKACKISATSCGDKELRDVDLYYAVDQLTWKKFETKIKSCKR